MESKSKYLKKVFKLVIKDIEAYFIKRKYMYLIAISLIALCVFSYLIYILLWQNIYLYLITLLLCLLILLMAFVIVVEPPLTASFEYRKNGDNLLIDNNINAFDIDSNHIFEKKGTFQKTVIIRQNLLMLSEENRNNLYYYFISKQKTNKSNAAIQQAMISLFTILSSAMTIYYKERIENWLFILLLIFTIGFILYSNYFIGNRKRNLTEHFIINVLKDSLKK